MSMLLGSGFTGNIVSAQTYTTLGLCIEEEPENQELQFVDGSPVTTKERIKLRIKCDQYQMWSGQKCFLTCRSRQFWGCSGWCRRTQTSAGLVGQLPW